MFQFLCRYVCLESSVQKAPYSKTAWQFLQTETDLVKTYYYVQHDIPLKQASFIVAKRKVRQWEYDKEVNATLFFQRFLFI